MLRTLAVMIAATSLSLTGCGARPGETQRGGALAGTAWVVKAAEGATPTGTAGAALAFGADGGVTGNDGCNSFRGDYTATGTAIAFGANLAATQMACPEPVEARARSFRDALQRAARFVLDDTALSLLDRAGQRLVSLVPARTSPVGPTWEATAYNNGAQGVASVIAGTHLTAHFDGDRQLTGGAGCNRFTADFELSGEAIRIGPIGATRRFCADPEGLMQQEALYLEALRSAASFRLTGERLELRTADQALAVTLSAPAGE